jgi:ComF family protein
MLPILSDLGAFDLIIPLPLNPVKARDRGFSQTLLLARSLSKATGVPWTDRALKRIRNTRSQTGLSGDERRGNVRGAFRAGASDLIEERTILLVDDVMTTGATMNEASRALLRAGCSRVYGIAAATAETRPHT